MFDTVKLRIIDYELTSKAKDNFQIQRGTYKLGDKNIYDGPVLMEYEGQHVQGVKAYHNSKLLNITLKASPDGTRPIYVQTSIPKLVHGDNYHIIRNAEETKRGLGIIQRELDTIGIACNLNESKVSRLDVVKNCELQAPFRTYMKLFTLLHMPYKATRQYGDGVLIHSSYEEVCIYDKKEEMIRNGKNVADLPENIARVEWRALNAKTVKTQMKVQSPVDLVNSYEEITSAYKQRLTSKIFTVSPEEIESEVDSFYELFLYFKQKSPRNWLSKAKEDLGLEYMVKTIGITRYENILSAFIPISSLKYKRALNEVRRKEKMLLMDMIDNGSKVSYRALYDDFLNKLVA